MAESQHLENSKLKENGKESRLDDAITRYEKNLESLKDCLSILTKQKEDAEVCLKYQREKVMELENKQLMVQQALRALSKLTQCTPIEETPPKYNQK